MARLITLEDLAPYIGHDTDESAYIKSAADYCDEVIDRFYGEGHNFGSALPWGKAEHLIRFRPGETSLWLGINGHGKSLLLGQLLQGFMAAGDKGCIASFEMRPAATLGRMARQASEGPEPSIAFLKDWHAWTDGKLWIYDQQGTVKAERVLSVCRYFAKELKGSHMVIDSLMKCGIAEDDYNKQKWFLDEITACARDTGLHIHLVHHSRKLGDENAPPGKMDAKGTGALTDLVDNCITVWRNKKKEAKMAAGTGDASACDAMMIVDKQRHGEWEGKILLWFDPRSTQYVASYGAKPINLMRA